jgi:bifunctional non-homologous end joining protein LigD
MFVDYLRNERGATAISPWSTRSRDGAPVAFPVTWDELRTVRAANAFPISVAAARASESDPWTGYFSLHQTITSRMRAAVGLT